MSAADKLLDVQHVTVEFHIGGLVGGSLLVAVNDVSFSLDMDQPEIFTLAGESGCGSGASPPARARGPSPSLASASASPCR